MLVNSLTREKHVHSTVEKQKATTRNDVVGLFSGVRKRFRRWNVPEASMVTYPYLLFSTLPRHVCSRTIRSACTNNQSGDR